MVNRPSSAMQRQIKAWQVIWISCFVRAGAHSAVPRRTDRPSDGRYDSSQTGHTI
jgi:hypothetical protein